LLYFIFLKVTSFSIAPNKSGTRPMPSVPSTSHQEIATIETPPAHQTNAPMSIPTVTCDLASDISTSEANDENTNQGKDTLKVSTIATGHHPVMLGTSKSPSNGTTSLNELQVSPTPGRLRALSVGIDTDMVSEFDPSSSDSGIVSRCAVVKPLKFRLCQPIFGKKNQRRNEAKTQKPKELAELEPVIPKIQKPRDPEKEKRRIARKKEKRATLILGLIMGSFIACWLPFFFLYILTPACPKCKIPDAAFAIAFWLGYMNSALNPAIYTIFNKDFRRAFRRILFK